ncbi:MAG: D-alanine--D-alanine ligase family protein, partial [Oscillospiraceae bacterium]
MSTRSIGILFGGVSSEHEVSCVSAASIVDNIDRDLFDIYPVGITADGRWLLTTGNTDEMRSGKWEKDPSCEPAVISPDRSVHGLYVSGRNPRTIRLDAVFPVLHGKNGEDGTMQGLLDISGIPYVGCGVLSSALCMDKIAEAIMLEASGIKHAEWAAVYPEDMDSGSSLVERLEEKLGYPMFVKPANAGSSVGISKVHSRTELVPALELAFKYDCKAIAEKAVVGREFEAAAFGSGADVFVSDAAEIRPRNEFYDYESKYINASETVLPAEMSSELSEHLKKTAAAAYRALGCRGMARVDF